MTYNEFYESLLSCGMISVNRRNLIKFLDAEIGNIDDEDNIMKLFIMYFSLMDDGNVFMSLDENALIKKFENKCEAQKIAFEEDEKNQEIIGRIDDVFSEIKIAAGDIDKISNLNVVGKDKLFIVDEEKKRLFTRKYYNAVESIKKSVGKLFKNATAQTDITLPKTANLSAKQMDVVVNGVDKNILVTGGPGTGKTYSIFFLLLEILKNNPDYEINLTAPSGKAADRMKESINNVPSSTYAGENQDIIDKIKNLEGQTIHRLLGYDHNSQGFKMNAKNQFSKNSIFVIDEASMIDVCIFASLLEAIPEGARVFILGDKDQLPSVESGAVFSELLDILLDNKVELDESKRFAAGSTIYALAQKINKGVPLGIAQSNFAPISTFAITQYDANVGNQVFYYDDNCTSKELLEKISNTWYTYFFKDFTAKCKSLDENSDFDELVKISEKAKILCSLNEYSESSRSAKKINEAILKNNFDKSELKKGYCPGEILMITQNDKRLELFNGDCGITVKFKGDDTLYLMFKGHKFKNMTGGKNELQNVIFKIDNKDGEFVFYPIGLISKDNITEAFAITIHKSQGSDYENIMVILPQKKGHPLLNRQIVYTAVTRTKGNTYIVSNPGNLDYASKNVIRRDTGIE